MRICNLLQRKVRRFFYSQGRGAGEGQSDLPASAIFSNATVPYFGTVHPELHSLVSAKWRYTQIEGQLVLLNSIIYAQYTLQYLAHNWLYIYDNYIIN
jgi:hypothetical protein